jgi:hypothetical protein
MKIKFIGVPGESHASISQYGYTFPIGELVEVDSEVAVRKLSNHPHFAVELRGDEQAGNQAGNLPSREELDAALASLPGEYNDPDYVVNGMRAHFGGVFTEADEATVRELVKAPTKKPSEGLTVDEIKAALAAKSIAIPEGVKLKADLAALLDAAPDESSLA